MTDNVDAVFSEATALHSSGTNLQRAETLYRQVLTAQPRHAHAMHQLGALLTQLYGKEKDSEALRLVVAAIQLLPSNAKFRNSLGVVHRAAGRWREAADAFERANEKDPLNVAVMMNLARALREAGREQRAAEVYGAVTKLQPDHPSAHYRRGAILRSIRRNEEALTAFRQHLRLHPEHQASKFWVAAITGDAEAMAAAPPEMVAGLFDQYADHFDDHLVNKLQYRTPEALRDQLLSTTCGRTAGSDTTTTTTTTTSASTTSGNASGCSGTAARWRRSVDLGCGTGLMGPLLQPYCDALEGVDLSSGMIEQASKRGCYSRLAVAELVAFLDAEAASLAAPAASASGAPAVPVPYDLLVAADVFVYIGDLLPVMRAAAAAAAPGAVLAFSVEALELAANGKANRGLTARAPQHGAGPETTLQQSGTPQAPPATASPAGGEQQGQGQGGGAAVAEGSGRVGGGDRSGCPGLRLQVTGRYAHSREYLERMGALSGWELVSSAQSVIRYNGGEPIWGHLCVMRRCRRGGGRARGGVRVDGVGVAGMLGARAAPPGGCVAVQTLLGEKVGGGLALGSQPIISEPSGFSCRCLSWRIRVGECRAGLGRHGL